MAALVAEAGATLRLWTVTSSKVARVKGHNHRNKELSIDQKVLSVIARTLSLFSRAGERGVAGAGGSGRISQGAEKVRGRIPAGALTVHEYVLPPDVVLAPAVVVLRVRMRVTVL